MVETIWCREVQIPSSKNVIFFNGKSQSNETIVLVAQNGMISTYDIAFTFQECSFDATSYSSRVYLSSALNNELASIVVMQCYIDASITGYFLSTASSNVSYFAIFGNSGRAVGVSPFVHTLSHTVAQSRFSMRSYLAERSWILCGVDYDLDLAR